jgi:hypothetical protein
VFLIVAIQWRRNPPCQDPTVKKAAVAGVVGQPGMSRRVDALQGVKALVPDVDFSSGIVFCGFL